MNVAYAHGGVIHGETPQWSLLADWVFDPVFLLPLLLAVFYARGYLRYRWRGGRRFPLWRPLSFGLGLAVSALALQGPVDALADLSFAWHMVQHDLLVLVAIPLMLLGAPFIPVVRGLPASWRRRAFIPLARQGLVRRTVLLLTQPLVALVLYELTFVFWHVPGLYDRALFNDWSHLGMHASFLFTGVLFWWNIVTPFPFRSRLHHLVRILMLFAAAIVNGAVSSMIVFSGEVVYGYILRPGFWGLTMLDDQTIGAGLMWVMGDMLRLMAIAAIFADYARQESAKEPRRGGPALRRST